MAQLTFPQVYALARGAGFGAPGAAVAAAISDAESGRNPDAVGDVQLEDATWGPSIGLWQIRSLKAASGTGTPRDATRLKDPAFNASAAYAISSGGRDFRPWSTYTSGAYRAALPAAQTAAGNTPDSSLADLTSGLPAAAASSVQPAGWNPLGWPGDLAKAVWPVILKGMFVAAGVGLGVLGVQQMTKG